MFGANNGSYDSYGGICINSGVPDVTQKNCGKIGEGLYERLSMGENITVPDFMCDEIASAHRKGALVSVFYYGVPLSVFSVIALTFMAICLKAFFSSPSGEGLALVLFPVLVIALAAIFPIIKIIRSCRLFIGLKKDNYEPKAFTVEEKYTYDRNEDPDHYVVLNGVWVMVNYDLYRKINTGDNVVCLLAHCGNNTYFVVSDAVL